MTYSSNPPHTPSKVREDASKPRGENKRRGSTCAHIWAPTQRAPRCAGGRPRCAQSSSHCLCTVPTSLPRCPASPSPLDLFLSSQDADGFPGKEACNHRENPQGEQSPSVFPCHPCQFLNLTGLPVHPH